LTVILGAGITGLSVAYHLNKKNKDFIIIEKEKTPGGLCRNINIDGYVFNYTGHFLHCRTEYVNELARKLMPDIKAIKRSSFIYLGERIIPYPIQANISYLPFFSRIKTLTGYIFRNKNEPTNLRDWFISSFGRGLYDVFFCAYNQKLWKYPLEEISPDFLEVYVPKYSFGSADRNIGYNAEFLYPRGGIGELVSSLSRDIEVLHGEVRKVDDNYVYFDKGDIRYDRLISTIPLPEFLRMFTLGENKPDKASLIWNSVLCINIGIEGELSFKNNDSDSSDFHWIYFPEKKYPFYRVGSLSNVSSELVPPGHSSVWVEISYREQPPDENIVDSVIDNLVQIGLFKKDSVVHISKVNIPYAYPIYDKKRENTIREIYDFLNNYNITLAGRFGKWEYSYMEESILEGKSIADLLCP
jgi:protoporphyrinogen oxidase